MRLEETDERYSFKGRTRRLVGALRKRGFEIYPWGGNYDISNGDNEGIGKIIASCEPRFRRLVVYDAPSNRELRKFARTYLG